MAIAPGTYDMTIQRRSDHTVNVTLTNTNITGYTVSSQVWDKARTTKAADVTIAVTNAAAGIFTWTLPDNITSAMSGSEYQYDVQLTNPAGLKEYWLEGTIYMDEGYTA